MHEYQTENTTGDTHYPHQELLEKNMLALAKTIGASENTAVEGAPITVKQVCIKSIKPILDSVIRWEFEENVYYPAPHGKASKAFVKNMSSLINSYLEESGLKDATTSNLGREDIVNIKQAIAVCANFALAKTYKECTAVPAPDWVSTVTDEKYSMRYHHSR